MAINLTEIAFHWLPPPWRGGVIGCGQDCLLLLPRGEGEETDAPHAITLPGGREGQSALRRSRMFQFQGYTLDIARHTLRAADREVALRPKSFQLLRYLVENPDRLVTTQELLRAIWPNVVVTNESLTHCVREVR